MCRGFWTRLAGVRLLVLWYNIPPPFIPLLRCIPKPVGLGARRPALRSPWGLGQGPFPLPPGLGFLAVMPLSSLFAYVGPFQLQQRLG